ncbi:hypothetical protein D3C81_1397130 [compost metagenome]
MILDALARLYPAADIHGIRPDPGHCIGDVIRGQSARENDRLAQALRYQRPVERLAGSTGNAFDIGVEQNAAGARISLARRGNVVAGLDPQRFDVRTIPAFALRGGFIAVELQQVQRHGIEDLAQLGTAGVDEQTYGRDKRRQRLDDRACLLERHRPRALGIKHKSDGIGPGFDRCQRIFYAGNPANLAANG